MERGAAMSMFEATFFHDQFDMGKGASGANCLLCKFFLTQKGFIIFLNYSLAAVPFV
jgi:hypothetical protein